MNAPGRDHPVSRALPTHQDFGAKQRVAVLDIHLRLKMEAELPIAQGLLHAALDVLFVKNPLAHLLGI